VTSLAAVLTVVVPAFAAVVIFLGGRRHRTWAAEWGMVGGVATFLAALLEAWSVLRDGPVHAVAFLGRVDTGLVTLHLDLRSDQLSGLVSIAVGLVAACVQIYSSGYLSGEGTEDAPIRYPAYAATVSLFTAAMMLVVHADDLVLLLIGWEVMGISSYLLIGHHSERDSARAAAVKAFLVTRAGDLGVLVGVVVLLANTGTTSISRILDLATTHQMSSGVATAAALLLLAGVAGKSAQFPLHTWLPDAMEGPTPVSALIHAATMVAAGVYLVARLLPLYLLAHGALQTAAVMASITMLGAALAALAQDDLKRLLAYSTVSQVAFMLAGVSMAQDADGASPGVFHLLSHAAFKALLFLAAGVVTHIAGSTKLADMGGIRRSHPGLALLLAIGLVSLAGVPPFSGFWSKESVLTAAENAAVDGGSWAGWLVLICGLVTTVVTGLYSGRAFALVALRPAPERPEAAEGPEHPGPEHAADDHAGDDHGAHGHHVPAVMMWPLWVLAVPSLFLGLVLVHPPALLHGIEEAPLTALIGSLFALAGVGWALSAVRLGDYDVAASIPAPVRAFLRDGFRFDAVQDALVVRPVQALARAVGAVDRDVVDGGVRGTVVLTRWGGGLLRRTQSGLATGYVLWIVAGAVAAGVTGVVLS